MRVFIAGAGNVGRAIAAEMAEKGHAVTVMDPDPEIIAYQTTQAATLRGVTWVLNDACEVRALEHIDLESFDVAIAATGEDQVNLVVCLLAKTEFSVPRTVSRINHPKNEWMFDHNWGVDVAVSTPRIMSALVEEAVAEGDFVRLFTFHHTSVNIGAITLPAAAPALGHTIAELDWPAGAIVVAVIRNNVAIEHHSAMRLTAGDELLVLAEPEQEELIARVLCRSDPAPSATPTPVVDADLLGAEEDADFEDMDLLATDDSEPGDDAPLT